MVGSLFVSLHVLFLFHDSVRFTVMLQFYSGISVSLYCFLQYLSLHFVFYWSVSLNYPAGSQLDSLLLVGTKFKGDICQVKCYRWTKIGSFSVVLCIDVGL